MAGLVLERRLEVPRCGEVAGMGVGFEDVGNSVAMFRYLCENIVGGGSAQGAGGWIKIEDGADDNSLFSLKACDDTLPGPRRLFGFRVSRLVCNVCFWSGCFNIQRLSIRGQPIREPSSRQVPNQIQQRIL